MKWQQALAWPLAVSLLGRILGTLLLCHHPLAQHLAQSQHPKHTCVTDWLSRSLRDKPWCLSGGNVSNSSGVLEERPGWRGGAGAGHAHGKSWDKVGGRRSESHLGPRTSISAELPSTCVFVCAQKCTPNTNIPAVRCAWWPRAPQGKPVSGRDCSEAARSQTGASQRQVRGRWSSRPQDRANRGDELCYGLNWAPQNSSECDCI